MHLHALVAMWRVHVARATWCDATMADRLQKRDPAKWNLFNSETRSKLFQQ